MPKPKDFLSRPPSVSQAISRNAQALVQEAKSKHAEMFPDNNTGSPKSKCDFSISVSGEKQNKFEDQKKLDEEQNQDYLETVSLVSQKILNDNNNVNFSFSSTGSSKWKCSPIFLKEFATMLHLNNHKFVVHCRPKLLLSHKNSHYDFGSEDLRNAFKISNVDIDSYDTENCSIPNKPNKRNELNKPNKI